MKDFIQPNPKILQWARESAGYSRQEVAKKLRAKTITENTITKFENGDVFPTYSQMEFLAYKIYKRPLAVFFFSEPPDESEIKKSFRTLPKAFDDLSPRMRFILRKARAMQLNIKELSEQRLAHDKRIFEDIKFGTSNLVPTLVKKVRKYLNISIEEQENWNTALKKWRDIIQSHGIFVFKDSFKDSQFSGFCLYDKNFPIIYLNNNESENRQIFTLFHELAHILFHTSGFIPSEDSHGAYLKTLNQKTETMCNEFAGAFLVPDESLPQSVSFSEIKRLANSYHVSQEVLLLRLLKNNIISNSKYEKYVQEVKKGYKYIKNKTKGGNYYPTQEVYLGDKYIKLAFKKYYQKQLSLHELSDVLNMKASNVHQIDPFKGKGVFE